MPATAISINLNKRQAIVFYDMVLREIARLEVLHKTKKITKEEVADLLLIETSLVDMESIGEALFFDAGLDDEDDGDR